MAGRSNNTVMADDSMKPWHRQQGETRRAYHAFCHYRDFPAFERAMDKAYVLHRTICQSNNPPLSHSNRPSLVALDGNRQNPAAAIEMRRLADGDIVTEGVDRGEADIPCPRRVAPVLLDMIEKRADERSIQVVEREARGRLVEPLLGKPEQQPKRIAIGRNGMGARPLLPDQPFRKEALQDSRRRGGRHGAPVFPASVSRSVASCRSSGTA